MKINKCTNYLLICLLVCTYPSVNAEMKDGWINYSPSNFEQDWELKENGFNSRRLDKKSPKKFSAKGDVFIVESHYQSVGKFLCTKKSYNDFIFEAEVMTSDLRSCAFVGYHGQFLDTQWKGKGRKYKSLHGFSYGFGNWPKTTGEAEIRYTGSKSLVTNHKEVEFQKNKWHKVKIIVNDNSIQHWFDGVLVAELKNVRETLESNKLLKSDEPMRGPIVLGMPGHPKGQKQVISVQWRKIRVKAL